MKVKGKWPTLVYYPITQRDLLRKLNALQGDGGEDYSASSSSDSDSGGAGSGIGRRSYHISFCTPFALYYHQLISIEAGIRSHLEKLLPFPLLVDLGAAREEFVSNDDDQMTNGRRFEVLPLPEVGNESAFARIRSMGEWVERELGIPPRHAVFRPHITLCEKPEVAAEVVTCNATTPLPLRELLAPVGGVVPAAAREVVSVWVERAVVSMGNRKVLCRGS